MPKKGNAPRPLRVTVTCSLLVAVSVVCGKFLQFPVGEALAAIGFVGGLMYRLVGKLPLGWRITLSVAAAHLVGSVVIKTFGLAQFYTLPFGVLMLWRLLNYVIVGAAECLLLAMLLKNKTLRAML